MAPGLTIRPLEDADVGHVVALWAVCGLTEPWNDPRADIARACKSGSAEIFIAVTDGRIVGSVMAGHDGHRGWLYYVAVAPDLWATGIGRRIVETAEQWLRSRGVEKVMLMVRPAKTKVQGFYRALGYQDQSRALMTRWLDGRQPTP